MNPGRTSPKEVSTTPANPTIKTLDQHMGLRTPARRGLIFLLLIPTCRFPSQSKRVSSRDGSLEYIRTFSWFIIVPIQGPKT